MNEIEFSSLMTGIKTAYPSTKIADTKEAIEFWWNILKDYEYKTVNSKLLNHVKTNHFAPSISDLIIGEVYQQIPEWRKEWGKISSGMNYSELSTKGKIACNMVSHNFVELCQSDTRKSIFNMKEFERAFNEYENASRESKKELLDAIGFDYSRWEQIEQKESDETKPIDLWNV